MSPDVLEVETVRAFEMKLNDSIRFSMDSVNHHVRLLTGFTEKVILSLASYRDSTDPILITILVDAFYSNIVMEVSHVSESVIDYRFICWGKSTGRTAGVLRNLLFFHLLRRR